MNSSNALCYLMSVSPVLSLEIFHQAMKKLAMNNTQTTRKPICLSDCNLPASLISLPSRLEVVFQKKGTVAENEVRARLFVRPRFYAFFFKRSNKVNARCGCLSVRVLHLRNLYGMIVLKLYWGYIFDNVNITNNVHVSDTL